MSFLLDTCVLSELVTHTLPLADYREAFRLASDHGASRAIKVVLHPAPAQAHSGR